MKTHRRNNEFSAHSKTKFRRRIYVKERKKHAKFQQFHEFIDSMCYNLISICSDSNIDLIHFGTLWCVTLSLTDCCTWMILYQVRM